MKKQILLIAAGGLLTLAACNSGDKGAATQAQIDSMANAKAASLQADMNAKNDSMIKAASQQKADSMMKAEEAAKHEEHKERREEHAANNAQNAPTQAPATVGNGKPSMTNNNTNKNNQNPNGTIGNGKPKM